MFNFLLSSLKSLFFKDIFLIGPEFSAIKFTHGANGPDVDALRTPSKWRG